MSIDANLSTLSRSLCARAPHADQIYDPRWTPPESAVRGLLELLADPDGDLVAAVTRRLESQLKKATQQALEIFPTSVRLQRARLLTLMIQGAEAGYERDRVADQIKRCFDVGDLKTKVTALQSGNLGAASPDPGTRSLASHLLGAWEREAKPMAGSLWRAYVRGMLKLADPICLPVLQGTPTQFAVVRTPQEERQNQDLATKALAIVMRDQVRRDLGTTDQAVDSRSLLPMPEGWGLLLGCRPGLESLLNDEWFCRGLSPLCKVQPLAHPSVNKIQKGFVFWNGGDLARTSPHLTWAKLGSLRLMDKVGLWWPLGLEPSPSGDRGKDVNSGKMPSCLPAVWSREFLRPEVRAFFARILPGPQRFRIHAPNWSEPQLWSMVNHLQKSFHPKSFSDSRFGKDSQKNLWLNDPRDADWEFQWLSHQGQWGFLLVPRLAVLNRFSYRVDAVPASSHGPIAAALVRLAAPQPHEVIWDPFCGAGTELLECALAAPQVTAYGTDLDPKAIEAAHRNGEALERGFPGMTKNITWLVQDAAQYNEGPPSLTITNPPLGRRVHRHSIKEFYQTVVPGVLNKIPHGGRLIWITPFQQITDLLLKDHGFTLETRIRVDLGGFECEMQRAFKSNDSNREN